MNTSTIEPPTKKQVAGIGVWMVLVAVFPPAAAIGVTLWLGAIAADAVKSAVVKK